MIKILITTLALVGLFSPNGYSMVAGYIYDFSKADYIIDGNIKKCSAIEDGLERLEIYTIKVNAVLFMAKNVESRVIFGLKKDDEIRFLYARHLGWPNTGYAAMVGQREKLEQGNNYKIPLVWDEKLALYGIFDGYYVIKSTDSLLEKALLTLDK